MDGVARPVEAHRPDRFAIAVVIAVYALSALLPLSGLDRVHVTLCPFRALTGLPCPGCGMTHAFVAIAHGNLAAAWHYNALSLPFFVYGLLWLSGRLTGVRMLPPVPRRMEPVLALAALAGALAFGAFRILVPTARPF